MPLSLFVLPWQLTVSTARNPPDLVGANLNPDLSTTEMDCLLTNYIVSSMENANWFNAKKKMKRNFTFVTPTLQHLDLHHIRVNSFL
jgi:hypothetical protein